MYEGLIRELEGQFHLIAPDYPGFGSSDSPTIDKFRYTFDHLAEITEQFLQSLNLTRFSLYMQDYGAPVGLRIAARHPEWIETLIVQDGNAYEEGLTAAFDPLRAFWKERSAATEAGVRRLLTPEIVKFFYVQGTRHPEQINPDNFILDQWSLQRPGNHEAHIELFYDYQTNLEQYPAWHAYFQQHQPPTLVVWGQNDPFFGPDGARAFQKDLKTIEVHLFNTGHFALEEDGDQIAALITRFIPAHLAAR
jgi:pimeloyl-ACP methyl ester carboxylesterase